MSEGNWFPKTLQEAIPYTVWGIFALGFGLDFCVAFDHAEWGNSAAAFACLTTTIIGGLYWRAVKAWSLHVSPNIIFVAVIGIILSIYYQGPIVSALTGTLATTQHKDKDQVTEPRAPLAQSQAPQPPALANIRLLTENEKDQLKEIVNSMSAILEGRLRPALRNSVQAVSISYANTTLGSDMASESDRAVTALIQDLKRIRVDLFEKTFANNPRFGDQLDYLIERSGSSNVANFIAKLEKFQKITDWIREVHTGTEFRNAPFDDEKSFFIESFQSSDEALDQWISGCQRRIVEIQA